MYRESLLMIPQLCPSNQYGIIKEKCFFVSEKIVLAYSGVLDTSVAIHWMREKYGVDIVTLTLDVDQADDLAQIETKSKDVGAVSHNTLDVKRGYVEAYVFPSIKSNALYNRTNP